MPEIIGCLIGEFANPFYTPVIRGVEDLAHRSDHVVFSGESLHKPELEKHMIDCFHRINVKGVIIRSFAADMSHLHSLEAAGIPVVMIGRNIPDFYSVNVDNEESGFLAGSYLLQLGHRQIGYASSGDHNNSPEQARRTGFRHALEKAGVSIKRHYKGESIMIEGGIQAAKQWLEDADHPTAVFCSTDMMAMGFIQHLARSGKCVPRDVSVLGHDDIPFADSFLVGLTTIAFPKYTMGHIAAQIVFDRIGGLREKEPQEVSLEPELIERQSCARVN
ncbi:MAG: substrate-binding domain-containing protein [Chloroflexota bacterium]